MLPVIKISPNELKSGVQAHWLNVSNRWLSTIEVHSPRSVPFMFVCLLLSLLFLYFSQFSPQRTFQAHFSVVIFLSDTVLSFTLLKEFHSKAAPKQDLFIIQITIHLSRFLSALLTSHSVYKLQNSIITPMIACYCFVQRHHLGAELEEVKI